MAVKRGCKAKAYIDIDEEGNLGDRMTFKETHTHEQEDYDKDKILLKQKGLSVGDDPNLMSVRQGFDDILRSDPNADQITFKNTQGGIYARRRKQQPPLPPTVEDFDEKLQGQPGEYVEDPSIYNRHYKKTIRKEDGSIAGIMFGNQELIDQYNNQLQIAYDGTFFTVPKLFYQLFSLMFIIGNHFFPLFCILMVGKSFADYFAVFSAVVELMPDFDPTKGIADFEAASRSAAEQIWANLLVRGCFSHYCRAVFKNLQKKGLSGLYSSNKEFRTWAKKIMAIPLLPANLIPEAFATLLSQPFSDLEATDLGNITKFKAYIRKQWSNYPAANLSAHGEDNATNNGLESNHATFKRVIKTHRPNPWEFCRKFNNILDDYLIDFKRLQNFGVENFARERSLKVQANIHHRRTAEEKLRLGEITYMQFLTSMAFTFEKQVQELHKRFLRNPAILLEDPEVEGDEPIPAAGNPNNPAENICVICVGPTRGIFSFQSCGHALACENCSNQILAMPRPKCPYCRATVTSVTKVFLQHWS